MITIEFRAETVSELKNNILAYARELAPTPPPIPKDDYREPVATKKKTGKASTPETLPTTSTPTTIVATPLATPAVPKDEEVQEALVAVNDKHGIDKAIECLSKFGVKRGRELTDAQKADFVALCKSVM